MKYYERIRALREDTDKKQIELAKILETSQSYYSEYELGKRQLPIHHLKTICLFYNISADSILGLPEGMPYKQIGGEKILTNKETIEKFYEEVYEILNWAEEQNFPKREIFDFLHNNIGQAKIDLINEIES